MTTSLSSSNSPGVFDLRPPVWIDSRSEALSLESTVQALVCCQFEVEPHVTGRAIAHFFERDTRLPGVILIEQGQMLGMISRQRFLESLLRPKGVDLFLQYPLRVLYSYSRIPTLVVSATTKIVNAARQALRRPPELQGEPIVVQTADQQHFLLSMYELNVAYWQIRGLETQVRYEKAQAQMIQSEKMASLGRLVDGVAHEILDPVGFIWGNLTHVSTYSQQLLELIAAYQAHYHHPPQAVTDLEADIELDYLQADLPKAIASIRSGTDRLRTLASSLQNFCYIDEVYPKPADVHDCLDSILTLLKERLTGEIRIVRDYGALPPVICFIGQLSQVFMNVLINAVDALINHAVGRNVESEFGESTAAAAAKPAPQITITTRVQSSPEDTADQLPRRWVVITIADNGPGLSPQQLQAILDSFSAKKRMEKETSLGLSYHIVTAKHGGKINVRSPRVAADGTTLQGTEFEILLPLA